MTDTASAAPSEREQFEAWWEAERLRTWQEAGCPHDRGPTPSLSWGAGSKPGAWRGWQAARAQPTPPAVVEPLTDEQISRISRSVLEAPAADGVALDAARYRMLRRGQHWSVIDGIGDTLRADVLDAAIDSAMALPANAGVTGLAPEKGNK